MEECQWPHREDEGRCSSAPNHSHQFLSVTTALQRMLVCALESQGFDHKQEAPPTLSILQRGYKFWQFFKLGNGWNGKRIGSVRSSCGYSFPESLGVSVTAESARSGGRRMAKDRPQQPSSESFQKDRGLISFREESFLSCQLKNR